MEKILIVEDNRDVNLMLAEFLKNEGYEVVSVFTGQDGLGEGKKGIYSLMLLDIMLPYKSGDEVLRELRESSEIPVIVISAKDMASTKSDMLRLGADDYITKPFDLGEVAARVAANLRQFQRLGREKQTLCYKDLELDPEEKCVCIQGKNLDLTAKEYNILELLIKNKGKVFSKANIYESIWGEEYLGDENAIKTHMSNLRTKLKNASAGEEYIETVWGLGYRLFKQ